MKKDILVIGSTNVDFLIKGNKLPMLGETVTDGIFMQNFGGKGANQAVGAARAGGKVTFVTCLGNDRYAGELIENFKIDGIDTSFIFIEEGISTGTALVMLDNKGNNYLSVAPGSNYRMNTLLINKAINALKAADIIVLQMEIPVETNAYIFHLANQYGKKILFNLAPARPFDFSLLKHVYTFVVNEVEASMVTGLKVETDEEIVSAAEDLKRRGPEIVIITLGSRGAYVKTGEISEFIPAFPVNAVDTTAAGDVYCGSLAVALVEGKSVREAMLFAAAASAVCVTKLGAQPSAPIRQEIEAMLNSNK